MAHSKRYKEVIKKVDANKLYSLDEAVKLIKETSTAKFDATVELHIRLGIDAKKTEQQTRGAISLPHGTGKDKKVAAFVSGEKEKEAQQAGADLVGGEELIAQIKATGKVDFDVAVATPDMMSKLAAIAKILGPKGLMPSPKNETISPNIAKVIGELKKGKVSFKNDDTGNINLGVGKVSFDPQKLIENITTVIDAVKRAKPVSAKGVFIQNISLSSSMGPGVRLAVSQ
jgi:large subunit ribosomal protein L1